MGFALLADHFESSKVPELLPKFLPHDWKGGFVLLGIVWLLSSFLDNIAGALIGAAIAHRLFRGKVHIAFVAAIVAASNAGGSWSAVGDTTTTMMWIAGVRPSQVLAAIIPAVIALFIFGIPAAIRQQRHSPILQRAHTEPVVDWVRVGVGPRDFRSRSGPPSRTIPRTRARERQHGTSSRSRLGFSSTHWFLNFHFEACSSAVLVFCHFRCALRERR
jgi:hypothetical protein